MLGMSTILEENTFTTTKIILFSFFLDKYNQADYDGDDDEEEDEYDDDDY